MVIVLKTCFPQIYYSTFLFNIKKLITPNFNRKYFIENDQASIQQRILRSTGSLGLKRRKPKRNADPIGFQEWQETDREFWKYVTRILRNWKSTERQCSALRRPITFFQNIKLKCKSNRHIYQIELEAYRETMKEWTPVPNNESFDLP